MVRTGGQTGVGEQTEVGECMSDAAREIQQLIERARGGDQQAARELVARFEPHVRRIVRTRLPDRLRSRFDSMDFVQSVWGDVFGKLTRGEVEFTSPERFAQFLAVVARSKVIDEVRRNLGTQKKNMELEVPVDGDEERGPQLGAADPTPSRVAAAREEFEVLLRRRKEVHRQVLMLRAQGYTFVEIAEQLGLDERTARRVVSSAQQELKRRRDAAE